MGTGSCNGRRGVHRNRPALQRRVRGRLLMHHIYTSEAEWRRRHPACAGCNALTQEYKRRNLGQSKLKNVNSSCNHRWRVVHSPRTKTRVRVLMEATRLETPHSHSPWWSLIRGCSSKDPLGSME